MDTGSKTKKFNTRAFVALMIGLCGIGLPLTGLANHAYAFSWKAAHHAWMSVHNVLGILFLVFAAWHALLNRRAFGKYVRGTVSQLRGMSRELVLAGGLVSFTMLIAIGHAIH